MHRDCSSTKKYNAVCGRTTTAARRIAKYDLTFEQECTVCQYDCDILHDNTTTRDTDNKCISGRFAFNVVRLERERDGETRETERKRYKERQRERIILWLNNEIMPRKTFLENIYLRVQYGDPAYAWPGGLFSLISGIVEVNYAIDRLHGSVRSVFLFE